MKFIIALASFVLGTETCPAEAPMLLTAGRLEPVAFSNSPSVAITREGGQVKITFAGTLQSANTVKGPWMEMTNAVSPILLNLEELPRFYRTREVGVESIFAARSVVALTVTGPFQAHFDLAYAGTPDGFIPPRREKPYFDGIIQMPGLELPVSLRVRGNSSLQECPFPKLKFKVSKEDRPGTPFFDAREVKIGTHCAEGGRGPIGRLRDETATYREALVYETMDLLGFITPRVRRARVEYRDTTTSTNEEATVGWIVTRNALIHDDIEVVAERLGGRALDDEEVSALTNAAFDEQLITDLHLLHALIGNWDYQLSLDGRGLWNTDVIALSDGKLLPVAGDFDLASWVTGVVRRTSPHDYHPELGDVERQALYEIEQIRNQVSATSFAAGINRFTMKREAIEGHIKKSALDEEGRTNALRHVTAFFDALGAGNAK